MGGNQVKPKKSSNTVKDYLGNKGDKATGTYDEVASKQGETAYKQEQCSNTTTDETTAEGNNKKCEVEEDKKKTEVKDLTPEEMEKDQSDHVAELQKMINKMKIKSSYKDDKGNYTSEVIAVVWKLYRLYLEMTKLMQDKPAVLRKWRNGVAKLAKDTHSLDIMCEIVKTLYPERWLNDDGKLNCLLRITLKTVLNYSAVSSDFAIAVAQYPGFCEKIKEILHDRLEDHINQSHSDAAKISHEKITMWCLCLTHNLSVQESKTRRLRRVGYVPLLKSYLTWPEEMVRLRAFATLAAIINQKECALINANTAMVESLLHVMSEASNTTKHQFNGWSCKESTLTIRMLARHDAYKKLLVELGALKLLVKMGRIGDHDEQYEAVSALWKLSLDADNRRKIANEEELGVVDLLTELKDSEDVRIRKVCEEALLTLWGDLKSSSVKKYRNNASRVTTVQGTRWFCF